MRALGVCLALAATVPAADRETVLSLVERLGAPAALERHAAFTRLASMGESILPILREFESADPEVRRLLRELTRAAQRVRLTARVSPKPRPIGDPVVIEVRIENGTADTYRFALVHRPRGAGTLSALRVETAAGRSIELTPDRVTPLSQASGGVLLAPGGVFRLKLELTGEALPLRRPGRTTLVVLLDELALRWPPGVDPSANALAGRERVRAASEPVPVRAYGRKPEELAAALTSGDPRRRASAISELELRDDAAVLPLVRRFCGDRDLRLAAVRRLGSAAQPEDLGWILDSTRSPDPDVREAAVLALGNYGGRRARARLLLLAGDIELQEAAIRALARHKHEATISRLIAILPNAGDPVAKRIQDLLELWTGMPVDNRLSEIRAFRRWWERNRDAWISENRPARN